MERVMAIVTREAKYAERLRDYINRRNVLRLTAVAFDSMKSCAEYAENHSIEMLLSDAAYSVSAGGDEEIYAEDIDAVKKVYLEDYPKQYSCFAGEGGDGSEGTTAAVLYKYCSAEGLIEKIIEAGGDIEAVRAPEKNGLKVCVTGIYSPVNRCGKTSFAITLCRNLSRKHRTILLDFGEFSVLPELLGEERTDGISGAIYLMKQGKLTGRTFDRLVRKSCGMEWLPPAADPEDFNAISGDDCAALINEIAAETDYEYIVADMNGYFGQADKVLDMCGTVYMPTCKDKISKLKEEAFLAYAENEKGARWAEKIIKIRLPEINAPRPDRSYTDTLLYGEMGDYVRALDKV